MSSSTTTTNGVGKAAIELEVSKNHYSYKLKFWTRVISSNHIYRDKLEELLRKLNWGSQEAKSTHQKSVLTRNEKETVNLSLEIHIWRIQWIPLAI